MDARLQNESVEASDEHEASRENPERSSSSCRRIPAGTLSDGSNVGTAAGFFSSTVAVADATSLPGLGDAFRPRVADTDRVLLPADRGSESPPPDAGESRPLELEPDIAAKSATRPNLPKTPPPPRPFTGLAGNQIDEAQLVEKHQIARKRAQDLGQLAAFRTIPSPLSANPRAKP